MPEQWYKDTKEVQAFGSILESCDEFEDTEAVHYYYAHPSKWNPEYEKWTELNQPVDDDDDGWDDFVEYLDAR